NVLHGRGLRGRCGDDDGVIHGAGVGQRLYDLRDRRTLLADGVVNTDQIAALAIDDGIDGNGGLSRLAVTDDEFALAAADGDHAVNRLHPGGHGFTHGLAIDHAGSEALDIDELLGVDRTFIVDG